MTALQRLFRTRRIPWPLSAATLLLLFAVIVPDVRLPRATSSYMVTFDITQSMNVADMSLDGVPVSRLAFARAAMRDALRRLPCGSSVGWSYFTGYRSFTLLLPIEVCDNYEVLLSALDQIDGRMRWANASNIAKGVYWARRNARAAADSAVIFFTDGQEAPPVPEGQPAMPDLGVPPVAGWLIGVGGDEPSRIPKSDAEGRQSGFWTAESVVQDPQLPIGSSHEHLSSLREPYLKKLATQTGLSYRRLESVDSLANAVLDRRFAHRRPASTRVNWVAALLALLILAGTYAPDRLVSLCRVRATRIDTCVANMTRPPVRRTRSSAQRP
jgi:mxaL protein